MKRYNPRGPVPSIYDRIPRDKREAIDRAIITRDPPTVREVIQRFDVLSHGVSKSSFYRYAERLRTAATLIEAAEIARLAGREPLDNIATFIEAEVMNIFASGSGTTDPDADPYAIPDDAFERIGRFILMRCRIAKLKLDADRADRDTPAVANRKHDARTLVRVLAGLQPPEAKSDPRAAHTPRAQLPPDLPDDCPAKTDPARADPASPTTAPAPPPRMELSHSAETPPSTPGTPQS